MKKSMLSTIAFLATVIAVASAGIATDAFARDGHGGGSHSHADGGGRSHFAGSGANTQAQEHHPVIDGLSGGADGGDAQWYGIVPR
jgi:hypothetical protein